MGLVKTRRLAAMQKQQRAKAGLEPRQLKVPPPRIPPPAPHTTGSPFPHLYKSGGNSVGEVRKSNSIPPPATTINAVVTPSADCVVCLAANDVA